MSLLTTGLRYELYGAPGGFPVLLHHGLVGSVTVPQAWADAARAQGIELISVAQPGCRESNPVDMQGVADWHELVAPVLAEIDIDQYGVWGVSAGAPYAYALAAKDRERVTAVAITSGFGCVPELRDSLATITAPVRMWHSPDDDLVPCSTARWTQQLIPGAVLQKQAEPEHVPSRDTLRSAMVFLALRAQYPAA